MRCSSFLIGFRLHLVWPLQGDTREVGGPGSGMRLNSLPSFLTYQKGDLDTQILGAWLVTQMWWSFLGLALLSPKDLLETNLTHVVLLQNDNNDSNFEGIDK